MPRKHPVHRAAIGSAEELCALVVGEVAIELDGGVYFGEYLAIAAFGHEVELGGHVVEGPAFLAGEITHGHGFAGGQAGQQEIVGCKTQARAVVGHGFVGEIAVGAVGDDGLVALR